MVSGVEIVTLITASLDFIKTIREVYIAINTLDGLPKAFQEVSNQLPLVEDTLRRARGKLSSLDEATKTSVEKVLQECKKNIHGLLVIFEAIKKSGETPIAQSYARAVIIIGKRGRVEDLMKDTLSNVKMLAEHQVFQLADEVEELRKAFHSLAVTTPSITDAEVERMFGNQGVQQNGDNNIQNTNPSHTYTASGRSSTVNTAGSGIFNTSGGGPFNTSGGGPFTQNNNTYESPWPSICPKLGASTRELAVTPSSSKIMLLDSKWLLNSPSFKNWLAQDSSTKVFWLHGHAGYGKSALCVHAIRGFEEDFKGRSGRPVQAASYFYEFDDGADLSRTVYRSLADSLFRQKYKIGDDISATLVDLASKLPSEDMLKEFIEAIVEELKVAYIFLDGLDEVFHDARRRRCAIDTLKFFLGLTTKEKVNVKIWCSSQDRTEIREVVETSQYHFQQPLTEEENAPDIKILIEDTAKKVLSGHPCIAKEQSLINIWKTIKGNFLWAAFALNGMTEAWGSPQLLTDGLKSFDDYLRIKIRCINPEYYEIFSRVMSCLVYAKRPLSFGELCDATRTHLYPYRIKERCSPFIHILEENGTQFGCSIYHTSVRNFFEQNPNILRSDSADEDTSISPRFLADATLRYLEKDRYRGLLTLSGSGAETTFVTVHAEKCPDDPLENPSDIINQNLLVYSAKYWAKHVDEFLETSRDDAMRQRVEDFVRSDNFYTCLQVQSLFVQAKFSTWYERDDKRNSFYLTEDAIAEWGYFLISESAIHGEFPGAIDKCQWPSLGKSNLMHRIKSRLKSYRLDREEEGDVSSSPGSTSSYFIRCGSNAQDIQVVSLQESALGSEGYVQVQQWTMKRPGRRHKPQKATQSFKFTKDQLRLYTMPLNDQQRGRAERATITGDGDLLRIGPKVYARDDTGSFTLLDLSDSRIEYIEETCRSGSLIAIVHRRGVPLAEDEENTPALSQMREGLNGQPAADGDNEDHSTASAESSSTSSSDSSNEDSSDEDSSEEGSLSQTAGEMQVAAATELQPEADTMDVQSESSNSAWEFHSEDSDTEVSDELFDDEFWYDWYSEDEGMISEDVDESLGGSLDESSIASPTAAASMPLEEDEDADIEMTTETDLSEADLASNASSDMSLKSTIPFDLWGDSNSVTKRSDDEPSILDDEETEKRVSDRRQLVIFSHDPSTNQLHRRFRFLYRWAGELFNSPPVIHPEHCLVVWPLGKNKILFANFANSPENTYFIRSLRCGARNISHISVQAKFSQCGQFLHLVCLDEHRSSSSSSQPNDPKNKKDHETSTQAISTRLYVPPFTNQTSEVSSQTGVQGRGGVGLPHAVYEWRHHVYATESYRILHVYRIPLYRKVEEREVGEDAQLQESDEKKDAPDSGSDTDMDEPKPVQAAFRNDEKIFLPKSADRRSVQFFPAPEQEGEAVKTKKKTKGKSKSSRRSEEKGDGGKVIGTVVISPEDMLLSGVHPYIGPPQVIHLTAKEFGTWKRLRDDGGGDGTGEAVASAWRGGQLEMRYEEFDNEEDCDIVPYFR
ncbi:hypothetical protein NM208_g7374 [Fusarium decemcellulare]|uniref:Uncharacterized protein n=1 Tax=Fusarium decemcellulare TaxID=57161 RepID=A0ACC1S9E9_9HYPO|nr:hypothetical protein NM208_g7374 [Fusarium decemcellulare]